MKERGQEQKEYRPSMVLVDFELAHLDQRLSVASVVRRPMQQPSDLRLDLARVESAVGQVEGMLVGLEAVGVLHRGAQSATSALGSWASMIWLF